MRWLFAWLALAALALLAAGCDSLYAPDLSAHPYLNAVAMASPQDGWIVGDNGTILRYRDGRWSSVPSPTQADLYGVVVTPSGDGWAVGLDVAAGHGVMLHEHGGAWSIVPGIRVPALRGITLAGPNEAWAVGDGGTILHLVNGRWQLVPSSTGTNLYSVSMVSPQEGWAVGFVTNNLTNSSVDVGIILHDQNGAWSSVNTVVNPVNGPNVGLRLMSVTSVPSGEAWLVGEYSRPRGLVLHYAGGHWGLADGAGAYALTGVTVVSSREGWAVGLNGLVMRYNGAAWTGVPSPTKEDLAGISMDASGDGWAVGANSTILHAVNGVWSVYAAP